MISERFGGANTSQSMFDREIQMRKSARVGSPTKFYSRSGRQVDYSGSKTKIKKTKTKTKSVNISSDRGSSAKQLGYVSSLYTQEQPYGFTDSRYGQKRMTYSRYSKSILNSPARYTESSNTQSRLSNVNTTSRKKIPKKNKSILGYEQTYGFEPSANKAIAR